MAGATGENAESPTISSRQQAIRKPPRNRLSCQVTLLDGTVLTTDQLQKNAKGLDLMHWVTTQLNISEKEYFGLLWEDKKGEKFWLNPQKKITTQLNGAQPNFALVVKFYEPVPSHIKTDYTRYLMCMQLRDDINSGRLPCSFGNQALLGSYVVQGDVGDYEAREHGDDYLDGMVFAPNQTPELLEKIRELHKENRGLSPEEADLQYLKIAATKLVMFGVDAHPAKDEQGSELLIGVSHDGIASYKDKLVLNKFPWSKIDYVKYRKRNFIIKSHPGELDTLTTTTIYKCPTEKAAKRLYKSCVEHHTFFRLTFSDPPPSRSTSLLKMGSKFRYSDRTLYQLHKEGHPVKEQPKFNRVSSLNWSRRYQMPSLSETKIYVDERDDDAKKRPLSEGDMPSKMPWYLRQGGKAPLMTEESTDTMTPEEREQYQREMAERLGKERGEGDEDVIRATGRGEGVGYAYGRAERPDAQATVTAVEEEARRLERERWEEAERERERQAERERERQRREQERLEQEKEAERERRLQEWIESEKRRVEEPERAGMAYTAPGGPSESATLIMREMKKEEPEMVSMGVATPVSGMDTIKRAEMRSADTDAYKGHVHKLPESELGSDFASRTSTWGGGRRDNVSSYTRTYTTSSTLPSRGVRRGFEPEEERRRSADDLDEHEGRSRGKVPLVTKDELVRIYSPGSSGSDTLRSEPAQHEIKRSLRDDLNLEHEQGTQDGGTVITRTIMMGGPEPTRTETIRQTTMPTEVIQKTITIEGDGNQLTAEELRDIISKHAGDLDSSEVVTTTYTTKVQEVKQTKTVTETLRVVDDDGNIIKTGDPETDAAIMEAIQRAKQENPNAKITEVVITRTDEESSA